MIAHRLFARDSRGFDNDPLATQGGLCLFAGTVAQWESFVVPDGRNRRVYQSHAGKRKP